MKKLMFTFICVCLCVMVQAQNTFSKDGIYYKVNPTQKDVSVAASPSSPYSGQVIIPAKVEKDSVVYNVTQIAPSAFEKSGITSIQLPEGLIEIGESAFRECQNLKAVVIPASVVNIEREAFIFCFSLARLTFKGKTRPTIGNYAFGKTLVKLPGISTGIPANMAVPNKDTRYKINSSQRFVIY